MIYGEQNSSTGYSWIIDTSDCENSVELVSDTYQCEAIGAPGTRYVTFRVKENAHGSCSMPFMYARPWEQEQDWMEGCRTKLNLTF